MNSCKYILVIPFLLLGILSFFSRAWALPNDSFPSLISLSQIKVKENLKAEFFPAYLRPAYQQYLKFDAEKCRASFSRIKLSVYSTEPEKYYLLDAFCQTLPAGTEKNAAVLKSIESAVREKGSNSDLLYAAGLVLAENLIFDKALQKFNDALWFKEFRHIPLEQYYFNLAQIQVNLGMIGEADKSLILSEKSGFKSDKFSALMLEVKLALGDRRSSIALASNLKTDSKLTKSAYLLRALTTAVDPTYHRKDLQQAAVLAEEIGLKAVNNLEVAVSSIKASLYDSKIDQAKLVTDAALLKFPGEPRLVALQQQIKNEVDQKLQE